MASGDSQFTPDAVGRRAIGKMTSKTHAPQGSPPPPPARQKSARAAAALFADGLTLHRAGRLAEAEGIYRRILAIDPDHFDSLHLLGVIAHQRGRHAEAVAQIDRALERDRNSVIALNNRGNALLAVKRCEEALASYDRALALCPDYADALCNRGAALHELRRYEEALESCERVLAMRPDFAEAYSNRGNTLRELQRFDEALESCERALALRPDLAAAHFNRGNALHELQRFEEALESHDRALTLRPDYAEALTNRGVALHELMRFDEALASYRRALAVRPDYAEAHYREAITRLLTGDFAGGWRKYEWRWRIAQLAGAFRDFAQPLWAGSHEIAGKTVLLHAEQGLGDTLQFCRYVPLVAQRGARVIVEVQPPLAALLRALPGAARVVERGEALPDFDLHCPLLSLPLAFATRIDTIPAATPYLAAPADKVRAWRQRLGDRARPRIGVVWAGGPRPELPDANRVDRQRSLAFTQLAPIFQVEGCAFYSLQKGDQAVRQLRESALRHRVIDHTDALADFADTAALVENLDLVISVDTAVAHLAGALGKPLWLINRHNTCWRWLLDRDDSPWYPSARLFRQDATRRWDRLIGRVADSLRDHVRARDGGRLTASQDRPSAANSPAGRGLP
jgi:tetratricopeptide (TPR) repeat protein